MEISVVSCSIVSISVILVSIIVLFYKHKSHYTHKNLPPGKTGFPLIGETLDFLSAGWKGQPEKFIFDRTAKYSCRVFKTNLVGRPAAVMCGDFGNKFLFSNENKLVRAWWPDSFNKIFSSNLQMSVDRKALRMKKLLPHFLNLQLLQRYIGIMDSIAQKHFERGWEGKEQVQVFPLAKNYTFWVACKLFLSLEDPIQIQKLAIPFETLTSGFMSIPIDLPGTPLRKSINASKYLRREMLSIIKQRKKEINNEAAKDILSHMLTTADENGEFMEETDIADQILGLLVAGHDTASATCTFIVFYLSQFPLIYDQVFQEQIKIARSKEEGDLLNWKDIQKMKYSWNVACEVMRVAPPAQGGFREAICDFTFDGFTIPKGWKLYWSANSTHKNGEYFREPEKFDPRRFEGNGPAPYTYVPFGGGPRTCPGKEYARLEILVFMHNLVKRFKFQKMIPDEKVVYDPSPRPNKGLPVRLFPLKKTS